MSAATTSAPAIEVRAKPAVFYHPELDILRFCAFLMVFVCHAMPNPYDAFAAGIPIRFTQRIHNLGSYGVDLFFALSAYLITEILLREKRSRGNIDVQAFYIRRILRIWPLYFSFLAFAFWVAPLMMPQTFPLPTRIAYLVFLGNWFFLLPPKYTVAGILWSVSIEEQFYLTWPLVLRFMRRFKAICLGLLLLATIYRIALVIGHAEMPPFWYSTFSRLDPIAMGALLAFYLDGRTPDLDRRRRRQILWASIAAMTIAGFFGSMYGPLALITYPAIAVACLGFLLATLSPSLGQTLNPTQKKLVHCGRISYGLYVFHGFSIEFFRHLIPLGHSKWHWIAQVGLAFVSTILLALISYRWLESPFLKLKDRFSFVRSHT